MAGARYVPIILTADGGKATEVVKGLTSAFNQLDDAAERTSNRGLRSVFLQADLGARAVAAGMREAAAAVQEYLRYGSELANLNTLLDDPSWLPKYRNGLLDLDPALGHTSELARGMYQAVMRRARMVSVKRGHAPLQISPLGCPTASQRRGRKEKRPVALFEHGARQRRFKARDLKASLLLMMYGPLLRNCHG